MANMHIHTDEEIASTDERSCADDLDSRFPDLAYMIDHFCYSTHPNGTFDYKPTISKTECQN
jgi:hypothetical protein